MADVESVTIDTSDVENERLEQLKIEYDDFEKKQRERLKIWLELECLRREKENANGFSLSQNNPDIKEAVPQKLKGVFSESEEEIENFGEILTVIEIDRETEKLVIKNINRDELNDERHRVLVDWEKTIPKEATENDIESILDCARDSALKEIEKFHLEYSQKDKKELKSNASLEDFKKVNKPENSEPENSEPENSEPENSEPENSEPENSEPENSEPEPVAIDEDYFDYDHDVENETPKKEEAGLEELLKKKTDPIKEDEVAVVFSEEEELGRDNLVLSSRLGHKDVKVSAKPMNLNIAIDALENTAEKREFIMNNLIDYSKNPHEINEAQKIDGQKESEKPVTMEAEQNSDRNLASMISR